MPDKDDPAPVPVQQDEPEACAICEGRGWVRRPYKAQAECWMCAGDGNHVPVQQDEAEGCDHVWRSSFGDTFCEKCNQDAPVEIAGEHNDL